MVSVHINGQESSVGAGRPLKVAELIELIKAAIDPEHMITSLRLDGRELEEQDWYAPVGNFGTSIIEIETGTPESFVNDRFILAPDVVNTCYIEFREARKSFQDGDMMNGNKKLVQAVNTARSFFEWYATLLELVPEGKRGTYDIRTQVEDIMGVCKQICQQQLYQSWWALGETIQKDLEPKLDNLESFCRKFPTTAHAA